jgi:hypothetical protein
MFVVSGLAASDGMDLQTPIKKTVAYFRRAKVMDLQTPIKKTVVRFRRAKVMDLQTPIKKTVVYFRWAKVSHDLTISRLMLDGSKLEQEAQMRLNVVKAALTDLEQRFDAGRDEVKRLVRDCTKYRNQYINAAREVEFLWRHVPEDFAMALSQARPWDKSPSPKPLRVPDTNSSPLRHTNSSPRHTSSKYSSQTSRAAWTDMIL